MLQALTFGKHESDGCEIRAGVVMADNVPRVLDPNDPSFRHLQRQSSTITSGSAYTANNRGSMFSVETVGSQHAGGPLEDEDDTSGSLASDTMDVPPPPPEPIVAPNALQKLAARSAFSEDNLPSGEGRQRRAPSDEMEIVTMATGNPLFATAVCPAFHSRSQTDGSAVSQAKSTTAETSTPATAAQVTTHRRTGTRKDWSHSRSGTRSRVPSVSLSIAASVAEAATTLGAKISGTTGTTTGPSRE